MAQKVQVLLVDDLDGSEAEGTVRFMLDGHEYEIDLSTTNAAELRKALREYVDHARKTSTGKTAGGKAARSTHRTPPINPTEVREWAKAHGIEVKDRGRVPAELITKFKAATRS